MEIKKNFNILFCHFIILTALLILSPSHAADPGSKSWMSNVADSTKLCELNIPGTHNSGTARTTIFTSSVASCQGDSISEQLKKGIRYLDIRINSNLLVNHGGVSCYKSTFYRLYFWDVLDYISDFLKNHPSETVIIQLKQEGDEKGSFSEKVNTLLKKRDNVYKSGKSPSDITLGDVRGKAIIFNRSGSIDKAYKCNGWTNDCAYCEFKLGYSTAIVQDKYTDKTEGKKMEHIKEFYKKVWEDHSNDDVFYINFTSCMGHSFPKLLAKNINKSFQSFIKNNRTRKFGIVMMDNPSSLLISTIYSLNYDSTAIVKSLIQDMVKNATVLPTVLRNLYVYSV